MPVKKHKKRELVLYLNSSYIDLSISIPSNMNLIHSNRTDAVLSIASNLSNLCQISARSMIVQQIF